MKSFLVSLQWRCRHRLKKFFITAHRRYKVWKFRRFKPYHVFPIDVWGLSFNLSFGDYPLDFTIIERIEGRREPITVATMRSLVQPGDRVLQIGGCYGYFASILSFSAGPAGKVVSVEGTPNNYEILRNNIRLNKFTNVDCYHIFISNSSKYFCFKKDERNPYAAIERSRQPEAPAADMVQVPAKPLSVFLEDIAFDPDHIFMDIEGYEVEVIEDLAAGYFGRRRPVIVFETHEVFYAAEKGRKYLEAALKAHRYEIRAIGGNWVCFPRQA